MANERFERPTMPPSRNGLVIKFDTPVTYTPPAPAPVTYDQVEIHRMVDDPITKTVTVFLGQGGKAYVLWSGKAYEDIGQWTDTDVANRLKEVLAGN